MLALARGTIGWNVLLHEKGKVDSSILG